MRQRQIQQATAAAEREALLAAPGIARGAGVVGRAAGLVSRAATIAAAPETTAAVALSGLAYGVGQDLLSNYGYANSTKSMPQRQRTPLNDPTSRGTHKVAHKHTKEATPPTESQTAIPTAPPKPKAIPTVTQPTQPKAAQPEVQVVPKVEPPPPVPKVEPPPQQPEVQASPAPVSSPIIPPRPEIAPPQPQQPEVQAVPTSPVVQPPAPGRFERSLIDLRGQPQLVHGFRIPRGRPYTLTAWERAARAKAVAVRGY